MKAPRFCLLFESEQKSGSDNLFQLMQELKDEYIKKPDYVFCLDSGCLDYDNFYVTTALKGVVDFDVKI